MFKKIDLDNDGVISKDELYNCFKKIMPENEAHTEVNHIFKQFDMDNHNEIDYKG